MTPVVRARVTPLEWRHTHAMRTRWPQDVATCRERQGSIALGEESSHLETQSSEVRTEMERAGQGHDAEKRHVGQANVMGGEGKFVFIVVAEFWYELP